MVLKPLSDHTPPQKGAKNSDALMKRSNAFRNLFDDNRKSLFEYTKEVSSKILVPNTVKIHLGELKLNDLFEGAKGNDGASLSQFCNIGIPVEFGGYEQGKGIIDSLILHQNMAYGSASAAAFFDGHELLSSPIILAGSQAQKEFFLPKLATREIIGCYSLSDVNCASDVAGMNSLTYTKPAEDYFLNGSKIFVTNGPDAHYTIAFAKESGNENKGKNITAFIVKRATSAGGDGFAPGEPMNKLGWKASSTSLVYFDNVRVCAQDIVGEVLGGFKVAATTLAYGRLKIAAEALGLMERIYDELQEFLPQRSAFGKQLKCHDLIKYQIAQIANAIKETRDSVYGTAYNVEALTAQGKVVDFADEAAQVKSMAAHKLQKVAELAVRMQGGYGFVYDKSAIPVIYCDAPLYMIGEGADNVLNLSVGTNILG
ncbi:acyl-CoA dehydrogenase [Candidatus Parvarchaeota archaeon]|nr:acyl-CoA dehydrogenase [Candidatus Parvarchaeota archaeon]